MLDYSQITVDFVQKNGASSATSMPISRQWNLSKHAAVVGTSGGAKHEVGIEVMESSCDFIQLRIWMYWVIYAWDYALTVTIPSYFDDCRFDTFVSKGLTVTSLIHIIDTPTFPVPPFQAIHAQQKNMAELLGTATKTYIPCCQRGGPVSPLGDVPKPPRFTVCDGSGSLRVRFFVTDGESQEWVLVILTVGFPQFWWIFLRSLKVGSHLALNIGWNSFPWNPGCAIFQTHQEKAIQSVANGSWVWCLREMYITCGWHPGHSPTWKICFLKHLVQKWSGFRDCTGHCPYPVSMIDLVWICRGTGVMVSSEIEDFQYVLTFV